MKTWHPIAQRYISQLHRSSLCRCLSLYLDLLAERVARPVFRRYPMLRAGPFTQSVCLSPYAVFFIGGQNRRAKVWAGLQTTRALPEMTSIHFVCSEERQPFDNVATTKQNTARDAGGPGFVRVPAAPANGWKKNYSSACSPLPQDVCFAIAYLWLKTEPETMTTASQSDLSLNI